MHEIQSKYDAVYAYMNNLNWDLIHSFVSVARLGSLSAAARELGTSQPTLSRNIQSLETTTQLNLFRRTTQGLELTDAGHSLMQAADNMDTFANQFQRQAAGLSEELKGSVRISANDIVGVYLLPPALKALREAHPDLQIEVVINNKPSSLNKREADIALRMFRPTQTDLVARRLPDLQLGFFAHREYLQKYGEPQNLEQLLQHEIIGMDESMDFIEGGRQMGIEFIPQHFSLRTDSLLTQISLARSGAGILATHVGIAERWPELQRILLWMPLPALEFWLVCHKDVQYNQQIATIMRFLGQWLQKQPYKQAIT